MLVFNKADLAAGVAQALALRYPGAVVVSAATGTGVDALLGAIAHQLRASAHVVELSIPYSRGDVLAALHREGEVLTTLEGQAGDDSAGQAGWSGAGSVRSVPGHDAHRRTARQDAGTASDDGMPMEEA